MSKFSFDGFGINDTDVYRSRLATLTVAARADSARAVQLGHLFAAAPELLAALEDLVRRVDTTELADGSSLDTCAAHAALARARGEPTTNNEAP